jgi:hypothetical protein
MFPFNAMPKAKASGRFGRTDHHGDRSSRSSHCDLRLERINSAHTGKATGVPRDRLSGSLSKVRSIVFVNKAMRWIILIIFKIKSFPASVLCGQLMHSRQLQGRQDMFEGAAIAILSRSLVQS